MKKILYTFIAILGFANVSLAQCGTIMVNSSTQIYPDTITNLPTAILGASYSNNIQFYCPTTIDGIGLVSLNIESITGLPSGFTYSTYPASGIINSDNSGCIIIQSSNVSAAVGTYPIVINATLSIPFFPGGSVNRQFLGYKINIPPPLLVSTIITNETCKDKSNGSIISTAIGGVSPYLYSINNGTYQTSNTFSNLSPGVYLLKVKDSINVVTQHFDTIKAGSNISVGNMVGSTLVAPNAISNYVIGQQIGVNYLWNVTNGIIANGQGTNLTQVIWSASAGTGNVKVKVTNSTGCSDSTTLNVNIGSTNILSASQIVNALKVYPNPASTLLHVDLEKPGYYTAKLSSVSGQSIISPTTGTVDISAIANGVYILSIYDSNNQLISTNKVAIIK